MIIPKVPTSLIVEYTGSLNIANILHKYIYFNIVFQNIIPKKILLNGQVQSGKTSYIINYINLIKKYTKRIK